MKIPNKIDLANIPTPLNTITFNKTKFFIKRDDLTGVELSGNKVRKLEYLIYQAKKEKADYVFTRGGLQSNHCRATVLAASKAGIKSKLFLWGKPYEAVDGNYFIDKFLDSEVKYLSKKEYEHASLIMDLERRAFEKNGKKVFIIPEGGSSPLGIWGYVECIEEMSLQVDLSLIQSIYVAAGSGGTAAGLLIGLALNNVKTKVNAVNVLYSKDYIRNRILTLISEFKTHFDLKFDLDENNLNIVDGYSEEGYKDITEDKVKVIKDFAKQTGIILDPAYTGKAFNAFNDLVLKKNKGMKNIFLHTGGLFGVFSHKKKYLSV
ncbi:MAG TPA: pyridoxal-phosphate dependent enzyme [Ignavibacteriaceae bacterium]|nr:pyridoxal-phosphate dependent enzyme [Ignavibacteriaceae bacterium]